MRNSRYLSESDKTYIKEHSHESPWILADKLGCSVQTIYYQLHSLFGDSFFAKREQERVHKNKVVRELYPTHSASEIAKILGVTKSAVSNMARRLGVAHTEETVRRITRDNIDAMLQPEVVVKRVLSLKRIIRMEQFRIASGEQQQTKRRLKQANNKSLCARNYLVRKYNYFYDKDFGEILTIFFDSETKRLSPERELYYSRTYHIKFLEADE
jgi:predicted transcriptional regulator